MNLREVAKAGRARGQAAASWKFDGNTTKETYQAFLVGYEDNDPQAMDQYAPPSWLSGEWAGESITELLGRDDDEACARYEDAATYAYWSTLVKDARRALR